MRMEKVKMNKPLLDHWNRTSVQPLRASSAKGLITGVCIGYFAKKVNSLGWGILFGPGSGDVSGIPGRRHNRTRPASIIISRSCCPAASSGRWSVSPRNDIKVVT
jgi:hypothetical protein